MTPFALDEPYPTAVLPACHDRDPEMFYPEGRGAALGVLAAKAVCRGGFGGQPCPVLAECLEIAMKAEGQVGAGSRFGIFGGKDPQERAALARRRYRARKV